MIGGIGFALSLAGAFGFGWWLRGHILREYINVMRTQVEIADLQRKFAEDRLLELREGR